jgi:hypothetical protein
MVLQKMAQNGDRVATRRLRARRSKGQDIRRKGVIDHARPVGRGGAQAGMIAYPVNLALDQALERLSRLDSEHLKFEARRASIDD